MPSEVIFDLDDRQKELSNIEQIMAKNDFWHRSQEEISRISQQRVGLKESVDQWNRFYRETEDARILAQMAIEENDEPTIKEVEKDLSRIEEEIKTLELQVLLGHPDDRRNAIVAINAGAVKIRVQRARLWSKPRGHDLHN
jgi:peptide chain release factor 2